MKSTGFINFLLWFSDSDPIIYKMTRTSSKLNRIGLSLFVLIIGVFAFLTSSYFIRTFFTSFNGPIKSIETSTFGWVVSLILGLFWLLFIVGFTKWIFKGKNMLIKILKLPFAIVIGLTLVIPFELQLFNSKINNVLIETNRIENQYNTTISCLENEIKQLKSNINMERVELGTWKSKMETDINGKSKLGSGPHYIKVMANYNLHKSNLEILQAKLDSLQIKISTVKTLSKAKNKEGNINLSFDFISQYKQFSKLKDCPSNKNLRLLANSITILFMMIVLIPFIVKIISNSDMYDLLIKYHGIYYQIPLNYYMKEIELRKDLILTKQDEKYQSKNSFPQIGSTIQ